MSRGVLDQEAYDAACRASAWAEKHGMKASWGSISYDHDGKRTFRFDFEPVKKPRAGKKDAAAPSVSEPKRVSRGVRRKVAQGSLDLPD